MEIRVCTRWFPFLSINLPWYGLIHCLFPSSGISWRHPAKWFQQKNIYWCLISPWTANVNPNICTSIKELKPTEFTHRKTQLLFVWWDKVFALVLYSFGELCAHRHDPDFLFFIFFKPVTQMSSTHRTSAAVFYEIVTKCDIFTSGPKLRHSCVTKHDYKNVSVQWPTQQWGAAQHEDKLGARFSARTHARDMDHYWAVGEETAAPDCYAFTSTLLVFLLFWSSAST